MLVLPVPFSPSKTTHLHGSPVSSWQKSSVTSSKQATFSRRRDLRYMAKLYRRETPAFARLRHPRRRGESSVRARPAWCGAPQRQGLSGPATCHPKNKKAPFSHRGPTKEWTLGEGGWGVEGLEAAHAAHTGHAAAVSAACGSRGSVLGLLGDQALGGEHEAADGGGVL